jgi:hypothetical protein
MPRNFSLVAARISSGRTRDAAPRGFPPDTAVQTAERASTISELADLTANDYAAVSF